MSNNTQLQGRPALLAARIVRFMRLNFTQSAPQPITTTVLRKAFPDVPRSSLMNAIAALIRRAGLQTRYLPGTHIREYCPGSQAFNVWRMLDREQQGRHAWTEARLLDALNERGGY
ncbi:hypothetical protein D3C77_460650 [compost metagenome]